MAFLIDIKICWRDLIYKTFLDITISWNFHGIFWYRILRYNNIRTLIDITRMILWRFHKTSFEVRNAEFEEKRGSGIIYVMLQ